MAMSRKHGTRSEYVRHGCRCDACAAANTEYNTKIRESTQNREYRKRWRYARGQKYAEYKLSLGGCILCGYNKSPAALDFHHLEKDKKGWGIGTMMYGNWDVLMREIDKCILLCSNCHREIHNREQNERNQNSPI
jgi:hypothetical protein